MLTRVMTAQTTCAAAHELLALAGEAIEAGQFQTTGQLAKRALEHAREGGDDAAIAASLVMLAFTESNCGHIEAAYSYVCEAYPLLQRSENTTLQLRLLNLYALVREKAGDQLLAVEIWRSALKSVSGTTASGPRCVMLYNLADVLLSHDEYVEAIQALSQTVQLARQGPEERGRYTDCASDLACAYVRYADHLACAGREADAQAQLDAAASILPPLDPFKWRSFSYLEHSSLSPQAEVLAALGHFARARSAAAARLRFVRQQPGVHEFRAMAQQELADLHRRSGRKQRAIFWQQHALSTWRVLRNQTAVRDAMRKLAQFHADAGDYAQALQVQKEAWAAMVSFESERNALSRRLAVIEREVEAQLTDARDKLAHLQHLSIIGRLIGQIHHALQAPIRRTQHLCALALRAHESALTESRHAPGLPTLLSAVSRSVDEAANLSRQIKIYAYRASAMTTTISVTTALHEVWATLAPHVDERRRSLRVTGDAGLHVRADPQRLGVLLTLVMIELVKRQSADEGCALVTATVEPLAPRSVALVLDSQSNSDATDGDLLTMSLVETLCKHLATEMGATLSCIRLHPALLRCILVMPDAAASVEER
jgi:tetratricopeptide (TPR) repeat protein